MQLESGMFAVVFLLDQAHFCECRAVHLQRGQRHLTPSHAAMQSQMRQYNTSITLLLFLSAHQNETMTHFQIKEPKP